MSCPLVAPFSLRREDNENSRKMSFPLVLHFVISKKYKICKLRCAKHIFADPYTCSHKFQKTALMESLYQKYEMLLDTTPTTFRRYLYDRIAWSSRMIGITGPRGVGKTTTVLQYIKENVDQKKALYITADDLFFSENRLIDVADSFSKHAGEYLVIDEIHKYYDWSRELKNIYDFYPNLKIIFTGSSVLDIRKGVADLSRRAILYSMQGLSFREYLNFFHQYSIEVHSLEQIVSNEIRCKKVAHPLLLFRDYLRRGYYPFGKEEELGIRLDQIILQTLETDIPQYANLRVTTARKLKHLLSIIAESVPFKPNLSKISEMIGVSRNSLDDYLTYMERAGLIAQLRTDTGGIRGLGKVDKVYLDNTNIMFSLVGERADVGTIRETFFFNQMRVHHSIRSSKKVDFSVGNYRFEIGGKNKRRNRGDAIGAGSSDIKTFIVRDDIETGALQVLPLWAFGLTY